MDVIDEVCYRVYMDRLLDDDKRNAKTKRTEEQLRKAALAYLPIVKRAIHHYGNLSLEKANDIPEALLGEHTTNFVDTYRK